MRSSLLIGNGINRSFDPNYTSLDKLLEKLNKGRIKGLDKSDIPFTLKVVLGTNNYVHESIKDLSDLLWGQIVDERMLNLYKEIIDLPVGDILTMNYGFELESAAYDLVGSKISPSRIDRITDYVRESGIKRKESSMFLHTYQGIVQDNNVKRIWHLHGHAKNPSSMLIGHYYYGNMLAKIRRYLQKVGNHYKNVQESGSSPSVNSWIDAFIMNDVYVLGFGYDFAEMDMWWLLERKNRENAVHGKVYFYEPYSEDVALKHELLRCYGADANTLDVKISKDNKDVGQKYFDFYKLAMEDIRKRIEAKI